MIELPFPDRPYRGVEPYRVIDNPIFFAREKEIIKLIRLVTIYRGVLLYGSPKVGKSSLVNAGLIPAIIDEGFTPHRIRFQPCSNAEINIENTFFFGKVAKPYSKDDFPNKTNGSSQITLSIDEFESLLTNSLLIIRPLLIFDQFEEIITHFEEIPPKKELNENLKIQEKIFHCIIKLLQNQSLPVKIIFVFHEDYLAKLTKLFKYYPDLFEQNLRLTLPQIEALPQIIRGPFENQKLNKHFGSEISAELARNLIAKIEERSDSDVINLTEVQICCLRLWLSNDPDRLFKKKGIQGLLKDDSDVSNQRSYNNLDNNHFMPEQVNYYYTLCSKYINSNKGQNELLKMLLGSFTNYFQDIIEDDELLENNFIYSRYNSTINDNFKFKKNRIQTWLTDKRSDHEIDVVSEKISKIIEDESQIVLMDHLFNIFTKTNQSASGLLNFSPSKRIIFIQGGIGSGKSTMLHHFARITLRKLTEKKLLPINIIPIIIDFNFSEGAIGRSRNWNQILNNINKRVRDGITAIYQNDIVCEEFSAIYNRYALNQIVSASDLLFQISNYLSNNGLPVMILIIYDNLDMNTIDNQYWYINKLYNLLNTLERNVFGIVAVRESTYNNLSVTLKFEEFMHLTKFSITTPVIGDVLVKRFNSCINNIHENEFRSIIIRDQNKTFSISQVDLRPILQHINTAFKSNITGQDSIRNDLNRFLMAISNMNLRFVLQLVINALKSWAFDIAPIVKQYLYNRDITLKKIPISLTADYKISLVDLPAFSVDQIIQLAFVGEHLFYDHRYNNHIYNVFTVDELLPDPQNGKFPVLLIYRIFNYFELKNGVVQKTDIENDFSIYGYRITDIGKIFEDLIRKYFIESPEGNILGNIKEFHATPKLKFYFNTFIEMLIYLENIRNDTFINYSAMPHYYENNLAQDLMEILKFINYIMDQEVQEFEYFNKLSYQKTYLQIVTGEPISWRLLRSVIKRVIELYTTKESQKRSFSIELKNESIQKLNLLSSCLFGHLEKREIWPLVSDREKIKMNDLLDRFKKML
jgi:hypothetical protein